MFLEERPVSAEYPEALAFVAEGREKFKPTEEQMLFALDAAIEDAAEPLREYVKALDRYHETLALHTVINLAWKASGESRQGPLYKELERADAAQQEALSGLPDITPVLGEKIERLRHLWAIRARLR